MKGFTLARLIITVAVLAILSAAVFVWLDPVAKIGQANDRQRTQEVLEIVRAVNAYAKDHGGALPVLGAVPTTKVVICTEQSGSSLSCDGDSSTCLRIADSEFYQKYMAELPIDPDKSNNQDTGYYFKKGENNQLVVGACSPYGSENIVSTTTIQVTCSAYAGGHCWYLGASLDQNCDTVCTANNLDCVSNIKYGPDDNSSSVAFGALNKDLGGDCSSVSLITDNTPSSISDDLANCYIQTNPILCNLSPGASEYPICACQ